MAKLNEFLEVRLGGIDITERCIDVPVTPIEKPEWGEIPSLPELSLRVINTDQAFSPYSVNSFLRGINITELELTVKRSGELQWKGLLSSIETSEKDKTATLTGQTFLSRKLNQASKAYFSQDTPSEIAKQLLILHNIPYDPSSFSRANDLLNDVPVNVLLSPNTQDWAGSLGDLLSVLAKAGVGRFFSNLQGEIGFDSFSLFDTGGLTATITDEDFLDHAVVVNDSKERVRGYEIQYLFGTVSDNIDNASIFSSITGMDFGPNSPVQIVDAGGAIYVGERWVEIANTQFYRIQLFLPHEKAFVYSMNSILRINSNSLGIDKNIEVIGLDFGDSRWVTVTGRFRI